MKPKTRQLIKNYCLTLVFFIFYTLKILLFIVRIIINPYSEQFQWKIIPESIAGLFTIFFTNIIILVIIRAVNNYELLFSKNRKKFAKVISVIKLCWPTLIFGVSVIGVVLLYFFNFFDFNRGAWEKILDLFVTPISFVSYIALSVGLGVGDLTYQFLSYRYHDLFNRLFLYQCEGGSFFCIQFPNMAGMAVFLSLSLTIIFILNVLAIKILKKYEKVQKILKLYWPSIFYILFAIISIVFYQEAWRGDFFLLIISAFIFLLLNILVVIIIKSIKKRKSQSPDIDTIKK